MNVARPRLRDPVLPEVEILLGGRARALLESAVGGDIGSYRLRQVTWWPGRSITVRYEVTFADGDRGPQIVACAGSIPDGTAIFEAGNARIGIWAVPNDPSLPGLASTLDPRTLRPMLESIGVRAERLAVRLRAYRPTRRAVVEVDTERTRIYVKLGRPAAIRELHNTHKAMSKVLPVPESLGYDPSLGILVMPSGRGQTMRNVLDGGGPLPAPDALDDLLAGLPAPVSDRRRSPIEKLESLTTLLAHIAPDEASRIEDVAGKIGDEVEKPAVPTHGDFHDGQLLVDEGAVTGLLDVDTHAMGHPADDPATMLGHLASRQVHASGSDRIGRMLVGLEPMWVARVDTTELRRRTAAVMLGLATGPFRVQQDDWPRQVRERIVRAETVLRDESPLIAASGPSHV